MLHKSLASSVRADLRAAYAGALRETQRDFEGRWDYKLLPNRTRAARGVALRGWCDHKARGLQRRIRHAYVPVLFA